MITFRVPSATYRIQFSLGFRFADARELVPYLHDLGITDLYASPRFKARRGSSHGYDVADPMRVNSELGTEREFEELIEKLQHYQMEVLLDIVPNHMVASHENPWWMDVLENGPSSAYAGYFDIDWHPATAKAAFLQDDKVLLPILGDLYGNVLENQELSLKLDEKGFYVSYYEARVPLDPQTYRSILEACRQELAASLDAEHPARQELTRLIRDVEKLPPRSTTDARKIRRRQKDKDALKQRVWNLYQAHPEFKLALDQTLRTFNGVKGDPASFDALDQLLAEQAFRLAFWKIAYEEINYRRFFDINDLVGLRIEEAQVFDARHAQIFNLIGDGKVTGLRIDHIDGLADPAEYLWRLQAAARSRSAEPSRERILYIVVEKILVEGERLPKDWPVCGTTGYDFLNAVNGVFLDSTGLQTLAATCERFTACRTSFDEIAYRSKKQVIRELFAGEVRALAHYLGRLAAQDRHARDVPLAELAHALVETSACLAVYRTYVRDFEMTARDRAYIQEALSGAENRTLASLVGPPAFAFLRQVLLLEPPHYAEERKQDWLRFVMSWQQFTGPVMAKGFEDTALYVYPRLISLNEVGGNPGASGMALKDFHDYLYERRKATPCTLNATSTHDSKRSEDVRARVNVLSELAESWDKAVRRWSTWNEARKHEVNGKTVPDPSEEMLLYQTLIGAWPLQDGEIPEFRSRVSDFMVKAAREAKVNTSWLSPSTEHEEALAKFTHSILTGPGSRKFLKDFRRLQKIVSHFGAFNSLGQLLLKIAAPGVPDFYQGNELWEFSLVDPDNRRPVDFKKRAQMLEELKRAESDGRLKLARQLLAHWPDGRIKLFLTFIALNFRKAKPELFLEGEYIPLEVPGPRGKHVCAFARRKGRKWAVVAVPRLMSKLIKPGEFPVGKKVWGADHLLLPKGAPGRWVNIFTRETVAATSARRNRALPLSRILRHFPVAFLSTDF